LLCVSPNLLLDADSILAKDSVSNRASTFIRRISNENNVVHFNLEKNGAKALNAIPYEFKNQLKVVKGARTPLFALLLHHLGLNRAFLEYSAHYLDLKEYAPALIGSIAYYYNRGFHVENAYIDACKKSEGRKHYDNLDLLMELVKDVLKMHADEGKPLPRGISNEQCKQILHMAFEIICEDERIPSYLKHIAMTEGEDMADRIVGTILNTCAFCFIWFHLHNAQVAPRVYGRAHAKHALLGGTLDLSGREMQTATKNLLKHIVMAVHRSKQHIAVNDDEMAQYIRARHFNLVTLVEKLRALKTLDMYDFDQWAQESQFADLLGLSEGEKLMYHIPADQVKIALAYPIPDGV
jgi:hypothetical protein